MDRKKKLIIGGLGALVAIVIVVVAVVLLRSPKESESTEAPTTPPPAMASRPHRGPGASGLRPGAPGARVAGLPGAHGLPVRGKAAALLAAMNRAKPGAPFGRRPGAPFGPAGKPPIGRPAQARRANPFAVPAQMAGNPMTAATQEVVAGIPHREDPFRVPWAPVIPPPPPVFQVVQPERIATAQIERPAPLHTVERVVPDRRVSGILQGDGIFAILEGVGDPEIVKPGSKTADGYRVEAISADSVTLRKVEGNVTYTQVVPLSDTTTAAVSTANSGGRPGGTGTFAPGGLGPGRGMRPGGGGLGPAGGRRGRMGPRMGG